MDLIYIGRDFYWKSNTMMSSIYTVDGKRMDWGFVQIALEEGKNVNIRQATDEEMVPYNLQLTKRIKTKAEKEANESHTDLMAGDSNYGK